MTRVSLRQWRRKRGPVAAAIVGLLEGARDGTYHVDLAAHGCPTVDMTLGAANYNRARLPFIVTPVADGAGGRDGALRSDEFAQVNSCCHSSVFEDAPLEADVGRFLSGERLPDTAHDGRLFGASPPPPADVRVVIERPPPSTVADLEARRDAERLEAKRLATLRAQQLPRHLGRQTKYHLRQRQLRVASAMTALYSHGAQVSAAVVGPDEPAAAGADDAPDATDSAPRTKHLPDQQRAELEALLQRYGDCISLSSDDMGSVPDKYAAYFLRIPTEPGAACRQRAYRLSHRELLEFEHQVQNLLKRGVIKLAESPTDFVSPVLFVPKPRNPEALRMCVDFRKLNAVTKRDHHALPDVKDLLRRMGGSRYFTALDLSSGFWALPILEEDQHKTAFTGPDGNVYVWRKAAMGLSNSPAAFQRFMSHLLQGVDGVSVYIDDITIYSKTWQAHIRSLEHTFARLRAAGLKVKLSKCVWAAAECRVLGSIVNSQGVSPDPEKTAAIDSLPVPRNAADVRSFLGASGYFHDHVPHYAHISDPLRRLLKKGTPFEWSPECQAAFDALKAALVSSHVLRMPDVRQPFILTTDWSKVAVGAVLSQVQPSDPLDAVRSAVRSARVRRGICEPRSHTERVQLRAHRRGVPRARMGHAEVQAVFARPALCGAHRPCRAAVAAKRAVREFQTRALGDAATRAGFYGGVPAGAPERGGGSFVPPHGRAASDRGQRQVDRGSPGLRHGRQGVRRSRARRRPAGSRCVAGCLVAAPLALRRRCGYRA